MNPVSSRPQHEAAAPVYETAVSAHGRFRLRRLCLPEDLPVLHDWVSRPYAAYWGLVGRTPDEVEKAYREIMQNAEVFLGLRDGEPVFLVECYDPRQDVVGRHYEAQPGDRGMHVLVAPAERPEPGFTWAVFRVVMEFLFSDPTVVRIVVEPDIRNAKIHALNRQAGFRYQRMIALPHKTAHLAFCTRADYVAALARQQGSAPAPRLHEPSRCDHLEPMVWAAANRALVQKTLSELSHERLLAPRLLEEAPDGDGYELEIAHAGAAYRFRARRLALDHWDIEAASIVRTVAGVPAPLDALALVGEIAPEVGLAPSLLPLYLEEIASTLFASAFKRAHQTLSAADLVHADYQEIEAAMTEGHPAFVANSGRIGFDARDYVAYAPEAGAPVQLVWLAAHVRRAEATGSAAIAYDALLREELGDEVLARFRGQLARLGIDPAAYLFLPVHPWQWENRITLLFAPDLAARDLVLLGRGDDVYRAQQSIRTFFNVSAPHKHYVKTALSVLNMGFMRGLSADYMRGTPAICDWVHALVEADPFFAAHGFRVLREVAGIGYRSPTFEALPKSSPYRKMLAALWRESPMPRLAPGERLMTMAALLHRDRDGAPLLPQLIAASGLSVDAWLDRYLACYLAPLLHALFAYDLAFMPHGENVILVLEQHVPVGAFMKDLGEEVVVMDARHALPGEVRRIATPVPEALRTLSIFTDVFDGFFRYLAQILARDAGYDEARFWARVASSVRRYRAEHPELADRMARFDLFAPTFAHSCLNRLQLRNNQQMVDLSDPAGSLQLAGSLTNPIAMFELSLADEETRRSE